ncbi:unnamed protein product [Polarella glacialis]|uniref:PARP catalytic domain-containing protein n=1 Tax=Polarella glacialis TaxID=89957 RepID=A0A813K149_POLGL|nr:unnamed protein product [Polarella glacialis]
MASAALALEFEEWRSTLATGANAIFLLKQDEGPPPTLLIALQGLHLELCVEALREDGRVQVFVQNAEVDGSEDASDPGEALDDWLAEANNFLADRLVALREVLHFLHSEHPPSELLGGAFSAPRSDELRDEDADLDLLEGQERRDELEALQSLGVMDELDGLESDSGWCHERQLPLYFGPVLAGRHKHPVAVPALAERPVLQEALAATSASESCNEPLAKPLVACTAELGLVQLTWPPLGSGVGARCCQQLGLATEDPLLLSLVLADDALGASGWQVQNNVSEFRLQSNFAAFGFDQPQGSSQGAASKHLGLRCRGFFTGDLLPRLAQNFLATALTPSSSSGSAFDMPGPGSGFLVDEAQRSLGGRCAGENVFLQLWHTVAAFFHHAAEYCPICLSRHDLVAEVTLSRCCPCGTELCVFSYEEVLSVCAELAQNPELVALQLCLAAAAAEGPPGTFEPFPPHLLPRRQATRGRLGTLGVAATRRGASSAGSWLWPWQSSSEVEERETQQSEDDKAAGTEALAAARATFARLPRLQALAAATSEEDLRASLLKDDEGCAQGSLLSSSPSSYRLVQFVLATNRLALHRLDLPEHQLPRVPSGPGALQLAVLQGAAPSQEAAFAERRRRLGSKFAFHGSSLKNWYSIMRNGLQVLSNTEFMSSGALFGQGIYLAEGFSTARHYCGGFSGSSYSCGIGEALQVMAVVEYIDDSTSGCTRHREGIITVRDPGAVMLRYLLIYRPSVQSSQPSADAFHVDECEVGARYSKLLEHLVSQ